jgi:hypothetical protein
MDVFRRDLSLLKLNYVGNKEEDIVHVITIIIIFLHGLYRLTCFDIDALPSLGRLSFDLSMSKAVRLSL